jgi:ATP phosphoribosyltransferase
MSRLIIGIPSKGRLQEATLSLLEEAGLSVQSFGGKVRDYIGTIPSLAGVDVHFLQAAEIIAALGDGAIHLGVTGEDLLREGLRDADQKVEILKPLGFGHADLVIAVPRAWIDVDTLADLDDLAHDFVEKRGRRLRVATKFTHSTRMFFASCGISDYRIVESLGATEGAPNAGTADIVVDITSTGETLAANGLKILRDGVMLKSQACLMAARGASWQAEQRQALSQILRRIEAIAAAKRYVIVEPAGISAPLLSYGEVLANAPTTIVMAHGQFACPKKDAASLCEALITAGAEMVTTRRVDALYLADGTKAADRFLAGLEP